MTAITPEQIAQAVAELQDELAGPPIDGVGGEPCTIVTERALRTLLALAADYVPREDRERAIQWAESSGERSEAVSILSLRPDVAATTEKLAKRDMAKARRLLKLDDGDYVSKQHSVSKVDKVEP